MSSEVLCPVALLIVSEVDECLKIEVETPTENPNLACVHNESYSAG